MVQTNGANTVAVSGNSTVPLATLASGTTYTVTVSAQPTVLSQTCTVTGPGPSTLTANVTLPITCVTNSYNIIATVNGLAGTGLHLQVAPTAAVAATANATPYTLASVISGGTYTVTVPTQPTSPTQSCVPAPSTGNVTSANVPVTVTCTTFTSTVGGSITGLNGGGLVLKDTVSGHQTAAIAAGTTTFAISPAINSGVSYNVVVLTQPTTPGQYCTVANPSGTVVGTAITNVAVTCRNEGKYAFVADSGAGTVTSFTIDDLNDATAGALTQIGSAVAADANQCPNPVAIAVNPAGTYLFSANNGTGDVSIFSVTAGVVALVASYPAPAAAFTGTIDTTATLTVSAVSAGTLTTGSFIYGCNVAAGTTISAQVTGTTGGIGTYTVNTAQTVASEAMTSGSGSTPTGVAVDPTGGYLLVTDSESGGAGQLVAYQFTAPGTMALANGSPFAMDSDPTTNPSAVAVDSEDKYVFATNQFKPVDGLTAFGINNTGPDYLTALTPAQIATGNNPIWVSIDPLDRFVYVSNSTDGSVSGYKIGAGGSLSSLGAAFTTGFTAGAQVGNLAIDPSGQFLYATDTANNQVVGFTIGAVNGALTPLTTGFPVQLATTPTPGAGPVPITIDPSGDFLYVGNTYNDTISEFSVNSAGQLTQITGSPLSFSGSGANGFAIE